MANTIHKLTAAEINKAPPGKHGDGLGLYLMVRPNGSRSWTFFYSVKGKRREMALGPVADLPAVKAREKVRHYREMIRSGKDPLAERDEARKKAELESGTTFGDSALELIGRLELGWKNPKHRQQWRNTLKTHCKPIWDRPIAEIDTDDVLRVISPIWHKTPETASRVRGRIERVLDAAKALGRRTGDNPARWRGHLSILLPAGRKRATQRHHASIPFDQIAAFIRHNRPRRSIAARALEFLILTAARTSEVTNARWSEIDLESKLWTVPAERMKMGVVHRVPLSAPAIAVLASMAYTNTKPTAFVFHGQKAGTALSNMSMEMLMRRGGYDDYTVHGMRSTFRDWCGEETDFPREIAEAALAHSVGNEVERAYRRGDALAKRAVLMDAWGAYCMGEIGEV